jgi:glutamate racemase
VVNFFLPPQVKSNPIGIFDSGVGGLTVASAIRQLLPDESILYFGDTAHLPYGDKSAEAIISYSRGITRFLMDHNAKVVVVACNSASATAYDELKSEFSDKIGIIDVINPVVDYICRGKYKRTGVIGTKRTIGSGTYEIRVREHCPGTEVISLATPLLVPMIEEGFIFDDISNGIIRSYLSNELLEGIDSLVLGCTHYPIIKNQISKFFDFSVEVVDSSRIVSGALKRMLEAEDLLNNSGQPPVHRFFVSDHTPWFEKIAGMFFEGKIDLTRANIWRNS